MLSDRSTGAQGLIPIPKPQPIPAPMPLPEPSTIQAPAPVQHPSVLPPFMGAAVPSAVPLPTLARPLVTGQVVPPGQAAGQRPQVVPPPPPTADLISLPDPEVFWRGTVRAETPLPRPEDFWRGTTTASQINLPTPEEFWRG